MNDNHIIDPGKLDTRIVIQTYSTTHNGVEEVVTWSTLATVWAAMDWTGSSESENSDQEITATTVVATIRYRSDIDTKMQVVWDATRYDITGITQLGRKRFQKLNLREVE